MHFPCQLLLATDLSSLENKHPNYPNSAPNVFTGDSLNTLIHVQSRSESLNWRKCCSCYIHLHLLSVYNQVKCCCCGCKLSVSTSAKSPLPLASLTQPGHPALSTRANLLTSEDWAPIFTMPDCSKKHNFVCKCYLIKFWWNYASRCFRTAGVSDFCWVADPVF